MNNFNASFQFNDLLEYGLQSSSAYPTPHTIPTVSGTSYNRSLFEYPVQQYYNGTTCMSTNHTLPSNYSESLQPSPLSLAAVKFREIPFYDPLHILLHPCNPTSDPLSSCQKQESSFSFRLSRKEVRDVVCNHECQILLRFCKLVTGTEQNDFFPPDLTVNVNGKTLTLEVAVAALTKKPLLITPFTKISSTVDNKVAISWSLSSPQSYAFTLYIAKPISSSSLLQNLRDSAVEESHLTRSMIIEKIKEDKDLDIAVTSIQASLLCPLGKSKMEYPCRASTCTHIACFDASIYIQLQRNQNKWKWQCPVCNKLALYENLKINELFMSIISNVPQDCTDVKFFEDGSWTPIMPACTSNETSQSSPETSLSVEIIDISSDDDTDENITVD